MNLEVIAECEEHGAMKDKKIDSELYQDIHCLSLQLTMAKFTLSVFGIWQFHLLTVHV